jgi:hypothetical protein
MHPFDFVMIFFSFIYSLGLAHLLLAVAHMIRYRRRIIFDWVHTLWMAVALISLVTNWISDWDFHAVEPLPLASIAIGFVFSIIQYLTCALVSPDIKAEGSLDLHVFQETQGRTYIGAFVALIAFSIAINFFGGSAMNIQNWSRENSVVIAMLPITVAPLLWRARWIQIAAPLLFLAALTAYLVMFYPALH